MSTHLIEKAKYELKVFERTSKKTGMELISEIERLRSELDKYRGQINNAGYESASDALST